MKSDEHRSESGTKIFSGDLGDRFTLSGHHVIESTRLPCDVSNTNTLEEIKVPTPVSRNSSKQLPPGHSYARNFQLCVERECVQDFWDGDSGLCSEEIIDASFLQINILGCTG